MNTLEHMIVMVKKANDIIRKGCVNMIVEAKKGYTPEKIDDCVTDADYRAQRMYVEYIGTHFPTYGIIAEEEGLRVTCTEPVDDIYFTIDPIDGTKAYARNQSHGVGTMIALVRNGEIIAGVIGDPNTDELYTFDSKDPGTRHRFGVETKLKPNPDILKKQYVLLKDAPHKFPSFLQEGFAGKLFKDIEVSGGSIGTNMARIWKGEVGAVILRPFPATPWDQSPIDGFNRRLGYRHFKLFSDGTVEDYTPTPIRTITPRDYYEVILHKSHIVEFKDWLRLR